MTISVCVSYRTHKNRRDGKKKQQKLLFAAWGVRGAPKEIRETYRKRFGIETSYRQWRQARIYTCTRDPHLRLLFFVVALVLRNVWLDLHETLPGEELSQGRHDAVAAQQERPPVGVAGPERGRHHGNPSTDRGGRENRWRTVARSVWCGLAFGCLPHHRLRPPDHRGRPTVKVIASSLRKGNIVELDGKLYVVLSAESFHPGKGTPTTQVDMRRISDGVKVAQRYKTTEQVERAYVEDREHQYLYQDGDGFHFMNTETYDQVTLPADVIGDQAAYLQSEMKVTLSVHEGVPVSIELPQKAVLEVVETEPTVKGQTAASSYKPALLANGVRTMVPPFVNTGTKIVVMTADGSYVERAKD